MLHKHQHIVNIAEIFSLLKVEDIVISPGSRNAPLTNVFYAKFGKSCASIVDERSAAYYALGKSLATHKPTVLICTSGTAALNYAPAIAEAFFQGVPLIVLTADRPPELIGQQDNQTIFQTNLYHKNIKKSYSFPTDINSDALLKDCEKIATEAFFESLEGFPGPVHINIPLREPLYGQMPGKSANIALAYPEKKPAQKHIPEKFFASWEKANSIYIICGQHAPDKALQQAVQRVSKDKRVVVFAEALANIPSGVAIHTPDVPINHKDKNMPLFGPTLVVYYGGHIISKKLKNFLQGQKHAEFYFVEDSERAIDTFKLLTATIKEKPYNLFNQLVLQEGDPNDFKSYWENKNKNCLARAEKHLGDVPYSDLKVFEKISQLLPPEAIVFSGNSSVVRYLHYFNQNTKVFYANRGTSGIDGCLSTAAGLASKTRQDVFAILGDLGFMYDSNALWNRDFPKNLKIIVVNNQGGGIFHLIQGPSGNESFMPFFNAHHPVKIKKIAEAFDFDYIHCNNLGKLEKGIQHITEKNVTGVILEIETPNNGEPGITQGFFNFIKS